MLVLGEEEHAHAIIPGAAQGDALGGGVTYGYSFVLSRRWSLETTVGLGMLHVREKKFAKGTTEPKEINHTKTIPAPLKAGITFTYILK